ncbi:MAG: hypothetical protein ACLGI8_09555 [Acidimicrobiia bacterium]
MTTTDQKDPWAFYDMLGVPHLERFLDDGANFVDLDIPETEVLWLAATAAIRWYGPQITVRGEDGAELMAGIFFHYVYSVMSGENLTNHPDGRVTVEGVVRGAGDIEVTEERVRHWQWMLMLFTRQDVADRFLEAVPQRIRAEAMARANDEQKHIDAAFYDQVLAAPTD